eukprot:Gregarina_sp_Poly_1__2698@NODE_1741_length_3427_cov_187_034821_g1140_i0_p1_GENE_NODE_1741_length_3427_cov_187_034821_g1140_i0NODE_1741_length_3427_cov_187_034821_g1140_i0_p1_ORF_typecomplete_len280_score16_91Gpr1_Fun34_YaaH/PF01184_19/0_053Gpr1_Fun34_YaaH/PF01184_19/1_7e03DUF3955/PF13127_6/2_9e03DUF3955/PF13127_6/0_57_NODE_1741_length_3427_cov_187_034821_g1140_i025223361
MAERKHKLPRKLHRNLLGNNSTMKVSAALATGGVCLFAQGVLNCVLGDVWPGIMLLVIGVFCWMRFKRGGYEIWLGIIGLIFCVYRLSDALSDLIPSANRMIDTTLLDTGSWTVEFAFDVADIALSSVGLVAFSIALFRACTRRAKAKTPAQQVNSSADHKFSDPDSRVIDLNVTNNVTSPGPQFVRAAPMQPMQPMEGRPPLQAYQFVAHPYGQPFFVAGGEPAFHGQPGILQPAGVAYMAHPQSCNQEANPTGAPVIVPHYSPVPPPESPRDGAKSP